jgi:hypothetical protein
MALSELRMHCWFHKLLVFPWLREQKLAERADRLLVAPQSIESFRIYNSCSDGNGPWKWK